MAKLHIVHLLLAVGPFIYQQLRVTKSHAVFQCVVNKHRTVVLSFCMTVLRNVQVKCLKELIVISLYLFFCHNLSIFYHKENGFVCAVLFILGRQMFVGLTVFKCNLKHIHTMMYNIFLIYDTQTTFVVLFYLTHNSPVLSYKKWFCYIIHKIVLFYYTQKSLVVSKTK